LHCAAFLAWDGALYATTRFLLTHFFTCGYEPCCEDGKWPRFCWWKEWRSAGEIWKTWPETEL